MQNCLASTVSKLLFFSGEISKELISAIYGIFDAMTKNDINFLMEFNQLTNPGNGPKFWRANKIDMDKLVNVLKEQLQVWHQAEYARFNDDEVLQNVLAIQYYEVKAELDSKKESMLFQLGLMQ